ncbi:hypothetical protein [Streptomyces virginiae]|uniref:hypothetical protein n=1 Tax=Streptomyces virginiae TaxID=1961 RepID=UPI00345D6392
MNTAKRALTSAALAATALALAASGASATDAPEPDPLSAPVQTITPLITKADDALTLRDSKDLASMAHLGFLEDSKDLGSLGSLAG